MFRHKKKRSGINRTTSNTTSTTSKSRQNTRHNSNQRKSNNSLEHKRTSDFIYTSPYELPPNSKPNLHNLILEKGVTKTKTNTPTSLVDERLSEVYSPTSVSFKISTTSLHSPAPPPLPERNLRRSVTEESGGNRSAGSSSRIITPPPLIDIKSRLQLSKNKKPSSPTLSISNSFRKRKNSLDSIKSNISRAASNAHIVANNLEVLLEVHESSGPTTLTNSTSSKENIDLGEKEAINGKTSSLKTSVNQSEKLVLSNSDQGSSNSSSENGQDVELENTNIEHVVSAQIHRNNNSALSFRSSNRSSRKSIQVPSPPRRKTLPFPAHVKNIASTQNSNSLPNQAPSSALQQLQALDLFKATNSEDEVGSEGTNGPDKSICLETDQYVKQIEQKRGKLISRIDSAPGDRLRRKVGYEIERRLVKVSYSMKNGYSKKKNSKRRQRRPSRHSRNDHHHHHHSHGRGKQINEGGIWTWIKNIFSWLFWWDKEEQLDESDLRRKRRRQRYRRRRRRHRFCFRCVTSSFHALFLYIGRPFSVLSSKLTHSDEIIGGSTSSSNNRTTNTGNTTTTTTSRSDNNHPITRNITLYGNEINPRSKSQLSMAATVLTIAESENSRTPTPKMLLDVKTGTLNWPVYQVGGKKGSGMLISTRGLYPAPPDEGLQTKHQPGRENFSLVPVEVSSDEKRNGETLHRNNLNVTDLSGSGGGGRKLVGWLQVRDPKNKKSFLQVVDPAPKGPFRKAPWHNGNFHVLKL